MNGSWPLERLEFTWLWRETLAPKSLSEHGYQQHSGQGLQINPCLSQNSTTHPWDDSGWELIFQPFKARDSCHVQMEHLDNWIGILWLEIVTYVKSSIQWAPRRRWPGFKPFWPSTKITFHSVFWKKIVQTARCFLAPFLLKWNMRTGQWCTSAKYKWSVHSCVSE